LLSFDLVNFICMIINILILIFIAKKFLFGRVNDIIAKRQEEVNDKYATADRAIEEAQNSKREYETQLAEFRKESDERLENARKEAESKKAGILEKAQAEADDIVHAAQTEADHIRNIAGIDRDKEVEELVFDVATRLAGHAINEEASSELYDKFLSQATNSGSGKE